MAFSKYGTAISAKIVQLNDLYPSQGDRVVGLQGTYRGKRGTVRNTSSETLEVLLDGEIVSVTANLSDFGKDLT